MLLFIAESLKLCHGKWDIKPIGLRC